MITSYLLWWYSSGWKKELSKFSLRLIKLEDLFSISLLLKTLFAPFHQYSANETGHGPTEAIKAWFNRSFSRIFGFIARTLTIIVGVIVLLVTCILHVIWLMIWPLLPLAPVIYVILTVMRIV
jgi:hypothetical protein